MSRGWTKWLQLGLAGVGLLALLTGLVAVSYVHNVRWDLSSGQRFTLSDYGLGVLRNLDRKVHITSFIRTQDTRNPFLKDLLWQAAHESPYLSYEMVDINRHPAVATSRGVHTYGASIVESDSRRADFSQPTETQLISAIVHVTQPSKKVYVWQGHGECSMADTHRRNGCSGLRDAISTEFYEVAALSLLAGKQVPADAAVVVIAGPRSDPLEEELRSLATYLDQGGKLLVMLEPFRTTALAALLGPDAGGLSAATIARLKDA